MVLKRWSAGVAALCCKILVGLLPAGIRRREGAALCRLVEQSVGGARAHSAPAFYGVWALASLDLLLCVTSRTSPIDEGLPRWAVFRHLAIAPPKQQGRLIEG